MNHLMRIPLTALVLLFSMSLIFAQTEKPSEAEPVKSKVSKETTDDNIYKDATAGDKKATKMKKKADAVEVEEISKGTTTTVKKTREEVVTKTDEKATVKTGFFKRLFGKKDE